MFRSVLLPPREKNFENLVKFYEEDLRRILRGEGTVEVFTRARMNLNFIHMQTYY